MIEQFELILQALEGLSGMIDNLDQRIKRLEAKIND